MKSFLDTFLFIFDYWKNLSILLLFVGIFILLYVHFKELTTAKKQVKKGLILVGQFFATIILWLSLHFVFESIVRDELKTFLSQTNLTIKLNNVQVEPNETNEIIKAFENMKWVRNHHSHPLKEIKMEISNGEETIELSIAQDTEIENEYWIFWNKYKTTRWATFNEIGRINSDILRRKTNI